MKKFTFIIIILLVSILTCYIFIHNMLSLPNPFIIFGWKNISITEIGNFKIPGNWIFTLNDNVIFLTDKNINEEDYKIYLIGIIIKYDSYNYQEVKDEINGKWLYFHSGNEFFKEIQYIETVSNEIFSNSTYFGIKRYSIESNQIEKYFIDLSINNGSIELISWDNIVSKEILINIAKTFEVYK